MTIYSKLLIVLFWSLSIPVAVAHEIRPSYLEIVESGEQHYRVTWKQPVSARGKLAISPVFPDECSQTQQQIRLVKSAIIENFTLTCDLQNKLVKIEGLERTLTDVFVRFERTDGSLQTNVLQPSKQTMILGETRESGEISYLQIGVQHILTGWDHLLFVFALILLVKPRQIFTCVTAFTVAHSLTLGISALDHVSLPSIAVEITVAMSIALMGLEILRQTKGEPSLTARLGWPVSFIIGLVHGFGFASAIIEIGLPEQSKLLALLFFNLGVEIGQLAVIGGLLMTGLLIIRLQRELLHGSRVVGAYCAGIAGTYWTIERMWSMFSF